MTKSVPNRINNRSLTPQQSCENCDSGDKATHHVVTGFYGQTTALCDKCYND